MRTLFEDTNERANLEDAQEKSRIALHLWLVAILAVAGAGGAYYWVSHRKPPEPPPVVVSLDDPSQINQALSRFNNSIKAGKWEEAQQMLSSEALKRLETEKQTLPESLLGKRKDDKVLEALLTPSTSRTSSTLRVDCVYIFADNTQQIIPLTLVIENGRLLVNSW